MILRSLPWPIRVALQRAARKLSAQQSPFTRGATQPHSFDGQALRWSIKNGTLEVELHREPCNEIGTQSLHELSELAQFIRQGAGGARALLFYSSVSKGFCAGADLVQLYEGLKSRRGLGKLSVPFEVRAFVDKVHETFNIFDAAPITTIAAVHGFCFGGGFELALTCDEIIVDKSARFAFPELRLGLVPGFGGIPRLQRDLGNAVVRDLLLTGRSINATKAHQVGLASQIVARGKALEVARAAAQQAARFDASTTAAAKAFAKPIPRKQLEREKDLFVDLLASPVVRKSLEKFVESSDVRPYLP